MTWLCCSTHTRDTKMLYSDYQQNNACWYNHGTSNNNNHCLYDTPSYYCLRTCTNTLCQWVMCKCHTRCYPLSAYDNRLALEYIAPLTEEQIGGVGFNGLTIVGPERFIGPCLGGNHRRSEKPQRAILFNRGDYGAPLEFRYEIQCFAGLQSIVSEEYETMGPGQIKEISVADRPCYIDNIRFGHTPIVAFGRYRGSNQVCCLNSTAVQFGSNIVEEVLYPNPDHAEYTLVLDTGEQTLC